MDEHAGKNPAGRAGPPVPKITKTEKRELVAGTEWESEAEWEEDSGNTISMQTLVWRLQAGDSYMEFHLTRMNHEPGLGTILLKSGRKGEVKAGTRADRVEMLAISRDGKVQRFPEQPIEVLVSAPQRASAAESARRFADAFAHVLKDRPRDAACGADPMQIAKSVVAEIKKKMSEGEEP